MKINVVSIIYESSEFNEVDDTVDDKCGGEKILGKKRDDGLILCAFKKVVLVNALYHQVLEDRASNLKQSGEQRRPGYCLRWRTFRRRPYIKHHKFREQLRTREWPNNKRSTDGREIQYH